MAWRRTLLPLAVAVAAAGWWWASTQERAHRHRGSALDQLSQDPARTITSPTVCTDEIIPRPLSIIDGLAVRSQTSSFGY